MAAFGALAVAVIAINTVVIGIVRRTANVLELTETLLRETPPWLRPPGLQPGTPVQDFVARDAAGAKVTAADLRGRRSVVIFLKAQCPPCQQLAADLERHRINLGVDVIPVVGDTPDERAFARRLPGTVLYQRDSEVARAFESNATPHAFAINEYGVVVDATTPNTADGLRRLAMKLEEGGDAAKHDTAAAPV